MNILIFITNFPPTNTSNNLGQELVTWQPEKKNPGLTPMDWVKFLASAIVGLVSFLTSI